MPITCDDFKIDTILPAAQTAAAYVFKEIIGRLGHYSVSAQSTVLLSLTAGLSSQVANNLIPNKIVQYASIPVAVGGSLLAHRFFFPGVGLNAIVSIKEFAILTTVLLVVKAIADNLYRLSPIWEKIKNALSSAEKKAEEIAKEGAEKGLEGVAAVAGAVEKEAKVIKKEAKEIEKKLKDGDIPPPPPPPPPPGK